MNSVLALLCVSLLVEGNLAVLPGKIANHEAAQLWKQWKHINGKDYQTYAEELNRFEIWIDNLKAVSKHNAEYDLGLHSFNMELNKFADLTTEEFVATRTGSVVQALSVSPEATLEYVDVSALPSTVDWRQEGYVTPVKDQGQCGSCWSFSTTGTLEGQHFNATNKLVSLSEQQMVDCDHYDYGCNGGLVENALRYLKKAGSVLESDYPYTGRKGFCKDKGLPVAATVARQIRIPRGNEGRLQDSTAKVGPISVSIDASHRSFQLYKSGVYYEPKCSSRSLDHAVLDVGYGTENGKDYWLVKNSWGTSWGEKGYIKMSRNRNNNCGIATDALYPECDD